MATTTPLLPTCLGGSITQADYSAAEAAEYDPTSMDYYKKVLPSTIPGIVLGALSLLCLLFFIIWIMIQYCTCCGRCGKGDSKEEPETTTQFIKEEGSYGANAFGMDPKVDEDKRRCNSTRIMQVLIMTLALATAGLSAWGIAASVENTDNQVSAFWALVDSVDYKVKNTTTQLSTITAQFDTLRTSLEAIEQDANGVSQLASSLGPLGPLVNDAIGQISGVSNEIQNIQVKFEETIAMVNDTVGTAVSDLEGDFKGPSLAFENQGRFIAIAVLFGLTILSSLLAGLLSLRVNHPVWASFWVAILWFVVTLLMLLGVGLLQGIYKVGNDTCLYAETFVVDYVNDRVNDPLAKIFMNNALSYYLNAEANQTSAQGSAINAITGVDVQQLLNTLQSDSVRGALSSIDSVQLPASNTATAIKNVATLVQPIVSEVQALDLELSPNGVLPIYDQGKSYICCDISSSAEDLFAAWTAVGCVAFVLGVLCSWRIVRYTFDKKKNNKSTA